MERVHSSNVKVEILTDTFNEDLQKQVNEFLESNNVVVIDMKFSIGAAYNHHQELALPLHSCLIIYQPI